MSSNNFWFYKELELFFLSKKNFIPFWITHPRVRYPKENDIVLPIKKLIEAIEAKVPHIK